MIITLGRQHGSNGHDIAKALSKELGCPCYDKEIVDHAAENSNFSREIFNSYDEKRVSSYIVPSPHYFGMNEGFRMNLKIASAQFDAIRKLAENGEGIFVGRCADYVLRDREDVLRVFIKAGMPFRIKTMMQRKGISEDQAKKLIKEVDKDRSSYYRYYTDQIWGDCEYYDLCIDSSKTGIDGAVKVIKSFMEAAKK